jgi:magnesium transporter
VRTLLTAAGSGGPVSIDEVRRRLSAGDLGFWLDIERPEDADYDLLLDGFGFHPLTVDDVRVQNQRPKIDEFSGYVFAVLFTVDPLDSGLAFREHHLYLCAHWLVTVHHEPAPALDQLRRRLSSSPGMARDDLEFLYYLVLNALVESLFPVIDRLDDEIDGLADAAAGSATPAMLARLTALRHWVTDLRRILGPQRDVFEQLLEHSLGRSGDLSLYWRDVYNHLIRQYEGVDSLRDLLGGVMEVYLSTVSNRLNATMKQLTVIASVFLPLTFLTGFFGMNFGYLVSRISAPAAFAVGLIVMLGSVLVQLAVFRSRGWI